MSCDISALMAIDPGDPDQAAQLLQECTRTLLDPTLWLWAIAFTVIGAAVGALIGRRKKTMVRDAILGGALGPIGWIISFALPAPSPKPVCSSCAREVAAGDVHCRHCGAKL